MKRTQVFTLVMAIFWTFIGVTAVLVTWRADVGSGARTGVLVLAFVAVVGNWMRYLRSR